jgi:hypothetical protein
MSSVSSFASRHRRSAASSSVGKWFMWRWMMSLTSSEGARTAGRLECPSPASASCCASTSALSRAPWYAR